MIGPLIWTKSSGTRLVVLPFSEFDAMPFVLTERTQTLQTVQSFEKHWTTCRYSRNRWKFTFNSDPKLIKQNRVDACKACPCRKLYES